MAVTGGGGSARKAPAAKAAPPRAKVVAAAKKRITGKANVAHGYAMAAKGGNFQGTNYSAAKPQKAMAHGYGKSQTNFNARPIGNPGSRGKAPVRAGEGMRLSLPRVGMPNLSLPKVNLPRVGLPFDPGALIRADARAIDNAVSGRRK